MLAFEKDTIKGNDIEALHGMRVASRRLQAILKLFKEGLPKKNYTKQYQNIKIIKDFQFLVNIR